MFLIEISLTGFEPGVIGLAPVQAGRYKLTLAIIPTFTVYVFFLNPSAAEKCLN